MSSRKSLLSRKMIWAMSKVKNHSLQGAAWDVLAAVRGPDSPRSENADWKRRFTCAIRSWARGEANYDRLGRFNDRADIGSSCALYETIPTRKVLARLQEELRNDINRNAEFSHYGRHLETAFQGVMRIETAFRKAHRRKNG